jgi:hypothetical protein
VQTPHFRRAAATDHFRSQVGTGHAGALVSLTNSLPAGEIGYVSSPLKTSPGNLFTSAATSRAADGLCTPDQPKPSVTLYYYG